MAFMFSSLRRAASSSTRYPPFLGGRRCLYVIPYPECKVAILGAAGAVGRRLSLFVKLNPLVSKVALYDVSPSTPSVAAAVSKFTTRAKVIGCVGEDQLGKALDGSDLVVITARAPRTAQQGPDDDDANAAVTKSLCSAISKHCPQAVVNIISNPMSSVPIASELFKEGGTYNENKLLGLTVHHDAKEFSAAHALSEEEVAAGKALYKAFLSASFVDSCLRAIQGIKDDAKATFMEGSMDTVEVVLCSSKSKNAACTLLESFEQWRAGRRLKIVKKNETSSKEDEKLYERPAPYGPMITEDDFDLIVNAPESDWPEVAEYFHKKVSFC